MKVISRSRGPDFNGLHIYHMAEGKMYNIISYSIHNDITGKWIIHELETNEIIFIPKKPKFYIDVMLDNGQIGTFWNDWFYSTNEMRKMKMKQLKEK